MKEYNKGDTDNVLNIEHETIDILNISIDAGKIWIGNSIVDLWSKLQSNIIDMESLDCFKRRLDKTYE